MSRTRTLPAFVLWLAILPLTFSCQGPVAQSESTPRSVPTLLASASPSPAQSGLSTPTPEAGEAPEPEPESTPVDGPWKVSLDVTKDPGKSYVSGYTIRVDSEGTLERGRWQNGVVPPDRSTTKSKVPIEALAQLKIALGQPRLSRGELEVGQGSTVLVVTRAGVTRTYRTEREAFIGPPGKVQQALLEIEAREP